jgi:hypothetical protein
MPWWRLQLEDRLVRPVFVGLSIEALPETMLVRAANEDSMLDTAVVDLATRMVVTGTEAITGLPPGDIQGIVVCDPLYLTQNDSNSTPPVTLNRPLSCCRRIVMPFHVPGHWMLVEICPMQGSVWIGDPMKSYGDRFLAKVKDQLQAWLLMMQQRWKEPVTRWVFEEAAWPQQPPGSNLCGPFVVLYAACRQRGWEPPVEIDGGALRRWALEMILRRCTRMRREWCRCCGTAVLCSEEAEASEPVRCAADTCRKSPDWSVQARAAQQRARQD